MIKKITISCLLLFYSISTIKAADTIASIELSNPTVSDKITLYKVTNTSDEAFTNQTAKDGVQCRKIPITKYAYFNVDDGIITSSENNLIFQITYYDEGTGNLSFEYNAINDNNYKVISINKTGTNEWLTAIIAITDASLRNAQNNNCDFRIDGNNYIKGISIAIGTLNPESEPVPSVSASSYSEFTGKSVAGYQTWFATGGANSGWVHWNNITPPSANHLRFEIYPNVAEYLDADLAQTKLANLGNGDSAKLFNSANTNVINKHFQWMKDYGIDGVAVQRFITDIKPVVNNSQNATPLKIRRAAETNGRVFYICYDISNASKDTWDDILKFDWIYNVEQAYALTSSPAYAKVGNKPVVEIWGTGLAGNYPGTAQETIDLINFFKSRGCYVIGGVPTHWRDNNIDAKGPSQSDSANQESFENVYKEYNMLSPWLVARFGDNAGADNFIGLMTDDKSYCDSKGIGYLPVIFSGFAWSQWNDGNPNNAPRNAGDFMWHQAKNIKKLGVNSMYFAMFDEYDEGTAIMKAATDWSMIPTD